MLDFATIRPALKALVQTIVGSGVGVYWFDQARPYAGPNGVHVLLRLTSVVPRSRDFLLLNAANNLAIRSEGTVTLRVRVERFGNQADGEIALDYLSTIQAGMSSQQSLADLRAVNLSVASVASSVDVPIALNDRIQSAAEIDYILNWARCVSDPRAAVGEGWIENVEYEGEGDLDDIPSTTVEG